MIRSRVLLPIVLIASLFTLQTFAEEPSPTAPELLRRGETALEQSKVAKSLEEEMKLVNQAVEAFNSLKERHPESAEWAKAQTKISVIAERMRAFNEAMKAAKQEVTKQPPKEMPEKATTDTKKALADRYSSLKCRVLGSFEIRQKLGPSRYEITKVAFTSLTRYTGILILQTKKTNWKKAGFVYEQLGARDVGEQEVTLENGFTKKVPVVVEYPECLQLFERFRQ